MSSRYQFAGNSYVHYLLCLLLQLKKTNSIEAESARSSCESDLHCDIKFEECCKDAMPSIGEWLQVSQKVIDDVPPEGRCTVCVRSCAVPLTVDGVRSCSVPLYV